MRLWTLHPRYLDAKGLVALWREALLAKAVLRGETRGYEFDRRKIGPVRALAPISATSGQIEYEWRHLMRKLAVRDAALHRRWRAAKSLRCHPLFRRVRGPVAAWERP
jgi:hypothetical protein